MSPSSSPAYNEIAREPGAHRGHLNSSSKAVFLSYASQDAEAARRICEALRASGIEVWFDQSELRGGDAWDQQIRGQVRDCALFIPIISGNSQARGEGYFRLEWDLADQRTHMVSRNRAFIVPVCIDGTTEREADVPDSFLRVQWTKLLAGETPARFCDRIKALVDGLPPNASGPAHFVDARSARPPPKDRRWAKIVAGALLVAGGLAGLYGLSHVFWPNSGGSPAVTRTVPPGDERSIAVLPFVNLNADPQQDFLSDGVAEEILNLLANVPGLRVTSRTSSFSFRGKQLDLKTIARQLGVSYIIEGTVQSSGGHVQVTAQLIDVASDAHLWSKSYERKLDDVFAIQGDVAAQVVHSLKIAMGADEATSLGRRPTQDIEAWQLFLKAREQVLGRKSVTDLHDALSNVEAALKRDPGFARAHSLRALTLMILISWDQIAGAGGLESERAVDRQWTIALQAAARALQLDPRLGEPYAVRAMFAVAHNDYSTAQHEFKEAVTRAPGNADAHNWYGDFLLSTGYLSRGFAEAQRAAALDPLSPLIAWQAAFAGLMCGHPEVVDAFSTRAQEMGWNGPEPAVLRGGAALERGDLDRAEKIIVAALPSRVTQVRMSFAAMRRHKIDAATRAMLDTLVAYGPPGLARFPVEAQIRDTDAMLATVYGTVARDSLLAADGSGGPARISSRSASDNLSVPAADWWMSSADSMRRDPRFVEFLRGIGLLKFWRGNGWPDLCGPAGDEVVCR